MRHHTQQTKINRKSKPTYFVPCIQEIILRNTNYQVWSYDVDVSNVACKCNAAMYWVNMPGYENGNPYPAE